MKYLNEIPSKKPQKVSCNLKCFLPAILNIIYQYAGKITKYYIDKNWNRITLTDAVTHGLLDVCKSKSNIKFNNKICRDAASNGHLHVLKWAVSNGCTLDSSIFRDAASTGHLHVLKWATSNGYPLDESISYYAGLNGKFKILKWAKSNCSKESVCYYAGLKTL